MSEEDEGSCNRRANSLLFGKIQGKMHINIHSMQWKKESHWPINIYAILM